MPSTVLNNINSLTNASNLHTPSVNTDSGLSTSVTANSAGHFKPDISPLLARYALTGVIQAIDYLTAPQHAIMDTFYRHSLLARENGTFNSLSHFVLHGMELALFTSAFDLRTPLAGHILDESRKKVGLA